MRRILLAVLLAAAATHAAAQRLTLDVPLSPTPGVTSAAGVNAATPFDAGPAALRLSMPSLAAPSFVPAGAVPLTVASPILPAVSATKPKPLPLLPVRGAAPAIQPALTPVKKSATPGKVIDSLKEHGSLSGTLSGLEAENGKTALESNFLRAASLDPDAKNGDGSVKGGAGDELKPAADSRPLLERMLERVRLDDRGRPEEKKALEDSFKAMLRTPTGRRYAEEFLAEGITAVVHFEDFPDSQLYLVNGRKRFFAAQAYTDWKQEGFAEVRLNRHYVDGDADYMRDSLPSIIGHELLGHGLWYGRAAKENLYLAFHYHELNETLARVVGWSIDHELDGKMEEAGSWTYLQDPAHYLAVLKTRLPYYAVTFSRAEMADAIGSMRKRLEHAKVELERAKQNLANQKTWLPVLDHFANGHGIPSQRFSLLRTELSNVVAHYESEVANSEAIVSEVSGLIARMEAEPNRDSQIYLQEAAGKPFFAKLQSEIDRATAALKDRVSKQPQLDVLPQTEEAARPKDQISWNELAKMYQDDVAADASRPAGKKHWQ